MSTFECKDCGNAYPTARDFVYHVETCADNYNPTASLQLQNAALFLRDWVRFSRDFEASGTISGPPLRKLTKNTFAWLKNNKLQGELQ